MIWFLLWLFLGQLGYNLALAVRVNELEQDMKHSRFRERKPIDWLSFCRGLSGVLLGPLCIVLVYLLNKKD